MAGTMIPCSEAQESGRLTAYMAASEYASSGQTLYCNLYQDLRNAMENFRITKKSQYSSTRTASLLADDFSSSPTNQSNLSYPNSQLTCARDVNATADYAVQVGPGDGAHEINLGNDSSLGRTIQFDLGSNFLSCSDGQSTYAYPSNSGIDIEVHTNQIGEESSFASPPWSAGNNFAYTSSSQSTLSSADVGNDSTPDFNANWDLSNNLLSSTANQSNPTLSSASTERRLKPYKSTPSTAVGHRIERAYEHRLYMIDQKLVGDPLSPTACDYQILGATGNVYTVRLATLPACTCPDPTPTCKHILFIMLRVLKLSDQDPRIWQEALLTSEVRDLLQNTRVDSEVLASVQVRQRFREISNLSQHAVAGGDREAELRNLQRDASGDCPVCYEVMANADGSAKEELAFCKTCGNNVHKDCFKRWSLSRQESGERVTCIFCRSLWFDDSLAKKRKADSEVGPNGYVNLADYSSDHRAEEITLERLYPHVRPKYLREWRGL